MAINPADLKLTDVSSVRVMHVDGKTIASVTGKWQGKVLLIKANYDTVVKKTNDQFLKDILEQQKSLLLLSHKYKLI